MKDIQKQVDDWAKQYKAPYWEPLAIMARLTEETGELAREINHRYGPKKKKSTEDNKEVSEEAADIIFTLACMANSLNIDLEKAFTKVMDKCYGRDKDRFEKRN